MIREDTNSERTRSGRRVWSRLWNSPWPTLGCEISTEGVSVARWSGNSSRPDAVAWKPVPAEAVEASPLRENIRQPEDVRQALGAALAALGYPANGGASRPATDIVLVIPDPAVRLFVLSFDSVPRQAAEALPLIRWRLKKSVPFDIESAAVSYFAKRLEGEWQVVALATPQAVVRQYEALVEGFGLRPRWVTLSTLATLGLLPGTGASVPKSATVAETGGQHPGVPGVLVGKYSPPWFTTIVLQGEHLRLFRSVSVGEDGDGRIAPARILEAIYPAAAYFQDNFGARLEKAFLSGMGESGEAVAELLREELRLETEPLPGKASLGATGLEPYQEERHFAALLGVVREEALA